MSRMNANIILAGQQPDFVNTLARSNQAAAFKNEMNRQNALRQLYQQQGPGIMAGEQGALNALAGFDPMAALGVQNTIADNRMAEQNFDMRRQEFDLRMQEYKRQVGAEQVAKDAEKLEGILSGAAHFYSKGDQAGYNAWLEQNGMDPAQYPFEAFPAHAAKGKRVLDSLIAMDERNAGPKPNYVIQDGQFIDKNNPAGGAQPIPGFVPEEKTPMVDMSGMSFGSEVGTIPQGYELFTDPETGGRTLRPIKGGPVDREIQQAQEQRERAGQAGAQNEQTRSTVVTSTVSTIRDKMKAKKNEKTGEWEPSRRGFFGAITDIPETGIIGGRLARGKLNQEAVDVSGMMDTLKGMVVFDRLEKLKQASATGASGLGQVTEREIALLGAQLGALEIDLSDELILDTLETVESVFGKLSPAAEAYLTGKSDVEPWTVPQPAQPQGDGGLTPEELRYLEGN